MTSFMRKVRVLSLGLIVAGLAVISGPAEPAEAVANCSFCTSQCPADPLEFCRERGCYEDNWAYCDEWGCDGYAMVYCALI